MLGCILRPTARVENRGAGAGTSGCCRWSGGSISPIFQHFNLLSSLTAAENVAMTLRLKGQSGAPPRAKAALAVVGLEHRWNFCHGT